MRLNGVEKPEGNLAPTATAHFEVETNDGGVVRMDPVFPVPLPYALGYRLARRFGVPIVRSAEPENLRLSLRIPRR